MEILSLEKLKNTKLADLIKPNIVRFIWTAILDEKVCDLCRSLDQKVMDVNSPDSTIYQPPLHPRCRCHIIPITSDAEKIPKVDWEKPKDSWIRRYAPFLLIIPFKGKKEEVEEKPPYAPEAPELIFNPKDVLSIEEYIRETELRNIEEEKQKMEVMEQASDKKIIYIIFFVNKLGQTILMKETEKDMEIDFSEREEAQIKKYASSYLINDGNDIVESQIENMFNIKKR